jgi:hypothetical protein
MNDPLDGRSFDQLKPEEQFSVHVNLAMVTAFEKGADPEALALIAENTSRELWEHYKVKEQSEYDSYLHFIIGAGFEIAEIEKWLDEIEAAGLDPGDFLNQDS